MDGATSVNWQSTTNLAMVRQQLGMIWLGATPKWERTS
jgi:hypothetical protein